jgi:hypothetical protein
VTIKLIAPAIDDAPDKWRLKMAKSTEGPEWASIPLNGGYTVQPVPAPPQKNLITKAIIRMQVIVRNLYYSI